MIVRSYWFARRFPLSDARGSLAPVSWQGYAVAGVFLSGMIFSALAWMALAAIGLMVVGIAAFVLGAALSGAAFIAIARRTADMTHTVEDYRTGRVT
jgi:hypothetical protein